MIALIVTTINKLKVVDLCGEPYFNSISLCKKVLFPRLFLPTNLKNYFYETLQLKCNFIHFTLCVKSASLTSTRDKWRKFSFCLFSLVDVKFFLRCRQLLP